MSVYIRLVILIAVSVDNTLSNRKLVTWIRSPRITEWGKWGYPEICPINSWVGGMRLKVDTSQGWRDDTALNAVQLHCVNMDWIHSGSITSAIGPWGNFRKNRYCTQGFAVGYQLRSERDVEADDVGAVDFKLKCINFDGSSSFVINSEVALPWGSWSSEQKCPLKTAVCGLITQVERDEGVQFEDETSLNNIDLACCNLPDQTETCSLEIKWEAAAICPEAKNKCSMNLTTGFTEDRKQFKLAKFYERLGFVVDFRFAQTAFQQKAKDNNQLINGKLLDTIIDETRISKNTTSFQINCEGMSQQLVILCGSYKVYTKEHRCVPNDDQGSRYKEGLYFQPSSLTENIFWSYNCDWIIADFHGVNSTNTKSLSENCGDLCLNNQKCTHFIWTKDGECWMKASAVNLHPIERYDKGLVCGWVERK